MVTTYRGNSCLTSNCLVFNIYVYNFIKEGEYFKNINKYRILSIEKYLILKNQYVFGNNEWFVIQVQYNIPGIYYKKSGST